jgi:hypothetical protein
MFAEEVPWDCLGRWLRSDSKKRQAVRSCAERAHPHFARRHVSESLMSQAGSFDVAAPNWLLGYSRRCSSWPKRTGGSVRVALPSPPSTARAVSAGAMTAALAI